MKKSFLILLALPFLLLSCEDALDDIKSIATFESTITGDVEKQFDGNAAFVHSITESTTPNSSVLTIALSHLTDQSEAIGLSVSNVTADGIVAGTYEVAILDNKGHVFLPGYITETDNYIVPVPSSVNTVTISSVTDLRVKGSFEINLLDVISNKTVKIVGTFDAAGKTETK